MPITVALDPNSTPAANKAELVAALNSFSTRGGEIRLPRSEQPFPIDPGIVVSKKNVTIVGEGNAAGYEDTFAGTQLKFTAGPVGIEFSNIDPASTYSVLQNVSVNGDNVCDVGVKINGISHLEHVDATKCVQAGIHLATLINSTTLNKVSVVGNVNLGLWVGGNGAKNNTIFSVRNLTARANRVGIRIENAMNFSFRDSVIESNYREGLVIYRPSDTELTTGLFDNVWFEANWRGELGYSISAESQNTSQRPQKIRFKGCRISAGGLAKAVNLISADSFLFEDLEVNGDNGGPVRGGNGAIDLGANCMNTGFIDSPWHLVTDSGVSNWRLNRSALQLSGIAAMLKCDALGVIQRSINVSSVSVNGALITVAFSSPLNSDHYVILPGTKDDAATAQIRFANIVSQDRYGFTAKCVNHQPALYAPINWYFICVD